MGRFTLAVVLSCLTVVAPAFARPQREAVQVRFGVVAKLTGSGCAPATLAVPAAGDDPVAFDPPVGEDVGSLDAVIVTAATLGAGQASWTVHPTAEECALYANDPSWTWSSEERPWSVTHRVTAYTIRATRHDGVTSVAGFRLDRRAPNIKRARRQLGRPSSLKRRFRVGCRARWKRIGLTLDLINLGGRRPCRHGFVQAGSVRGPRWTALVADDPGVALGTTDAFLASVGLGERGEAPRRWTLADVFIPIGDAGSAPSLSAILNRLGEVRGFEFWVGAGGD